MGVDMMCIKNIVTCVFFVGDIAQPHHPQVFVEMEELRADSTEHLEWEETSTSCTERHFSRPSYHRKRKTLVTWKLGNEVTLVTTR